MIKKVDDKLKISTLSFVKPKTVTSFAGRKFVIETASTIDPKLFGKQVRTLSSGTCAEKLEFLKHNVRFQQETEEIKELKAILSRSVFESVLGLIHTSEKKSQFQDDVFAQIDEGLSVLSEVDKGSKDVYQSILSRYLYKLNKFDAVVAIYKDQIKNVKSDEREQLLKSLTQIKKGSLASCKAWIDSYQASYEEKCLALLNKLIESKEGGKKEENSAQLSEKEQAEINKFFLYAYANGDLNKRIRAKTAPTRAEKFISEFTRSTMGPKKALESGIVAPSNLSRCIDEVNGVLDEHDLRTACKDLSQMTALEHELHHYYMQIQGKNDVKVVSEKLEIFFKGISSSSKSIWDYRNSPEYSNNLQAVVTALGGCTFRTEAKYKKESLKLIEKQIHTITQSVGMIHKVDDFLNSKAKKISYETFSTLTTFDEFATELIPIAQKCNQFGASPILHNLVNACTQSENVMRDVRLLMDVTRSSEPGDISIEDEVLAKNYKQSTGIAFSEFSIFRNFLDIAQLLLPENIWQVQPYYTGRRTHADIMIPLTIYSLRRDPDEKVGKIFPKISAFEGRQKFSDISENDIERSFYHYNNTRAIGVHVAGVTVNTALEVDAPLYSVQYRPDFEKILRQEKIQYLDEAKNIYSEKLKKRVEESSQWRTLQGYELDPSRGIRSFVMSLVPRIGNLKQYTATLWEYLFGSQGVLRPLFKSYLSKANSQEKRDDVLNAANKRFCTEFVAQVTKETLKDTEEELQKRFPKEKSPFLHEVIPEYIDCSELYGNKLEEVLKRNDYFFQVKPPKAKETFLSHLVEAVPEHRV